MRCGAWEDYRVAQVDTGESTRLFVLAVSKGRIYELAEGASEVPAPTCLYCRQLPESGGVQLMTGQGTATGKASTAEIYRDCEKIAELASETTEYVDLDAADGRHTYAVRFVGDGAESAFTQCTVVVGGGALLRRESSWPVVTPGQIARNPLDGSFRITGTQPPELGKIFHFDSDFRFVDSRKTSVEAPWGVDTLAIRVVDGQQALLYYIVRRDASASSLDLIVETLEGSLLETTQLALPEVEGVVIPSYLGLSWDPATDSFFLRERASYQFLQLDAQGDVLRTWPHPRPPTNFHRGGRGLSVVSERSSLLVSDFTGLGNNLNPVECVLREMMPGGALTGFEVSVPGMTAYAMVGADIFATGGGEVGELLQFRIFPAGVVPPLDLFLRGDSNGDASVNISDPVYLLNHLFRGGPGPSCLDAADGNDDGHANLADAVYVLNALFRGGDDPPPPFPEAGPDPTPDSLPNCEGDA
jgi:hypothetical protein